MLVLQLLLNILPMVLVVSLLPPPMVHPITILPPTIRLEVDRVIRVDVDERQRLIDGEDVSGVDRGSGRGLRRAKRVDGADVGGARERGRETERSEAGEGGVWDGSSVPRSLERRTRALPESESGYEKIGRRGGVGRRESETGVGEIYEDII